MMRWTELLEDKCQVPHKRVLYDHRFIDLKVWPTSSLHVSERVQLVQPDKRAPQKPGKEHKTMTGGFFLFCGTPTSLLE